MRRTSLERRTPLEPGGPLKRTGRLSSRGRRRAREATARQALQAQLDQTPTRCELGVGWLSRGFNVCHGRAEHWHERRKSGQGGSKVNRLNLMAACDSCNSLVEDEPDVAKELGYVLVEGDLEWAMVARRRDREGA